MTETVSSVRSFDQIIELGNVKPIPLPARSPNLNAFSERWVKSVKEECLSKLILFGEASLKRALQQYLIHYHEERNHQGKENTLLFPRQTQPVGSESGIGSMSAAIGRAAQVLLPAGCLSIRSDRLEGFDSQRKSRAIL